MTAKEAREMTEATKRWKGNDELIEAMVNRSVSQAAKQGLSECLIPESQFPPGVPHIQITEWLDRNGFGYQPKLEVMLDTTIMDINRSRTVFIGYQVMW